MVLTPNNILNYVKSYLQYDLKRELISWIKLFKFYLPLTLLILIVTFCGFIYIKPFSTQETYLAIGQDGSISSEMGKSFVNFFNKNGLSLNLENTVGLDNGLYQLNSDASQINASFVTSGAASREDFPNLVSLGSFEIAPLWLFYHGKTVITDDPFEYYKNKKISIGSKGTVTNKLFTTLLVLNEPDAVHQQNFMMLAHNYAAQALKQKKIDAMFIVDGFDSPIIQSLLKDPDIKLMNFQLADAYTKKLPFLKKVVVPKASIDINNIRPDKDISLLASSINLLVESNVHPSIQWGFLLAAKDFQLKSEHFFSSQTYPSYTDRTFPLSPVADRFYNSGVPAFFEYIPLWLGALIQNLWFIALAAFLIVFPLIKKIKSLRSDASQKLLWKHFWELRYLEDELLAATTKEKTQNVLQKLNELNANVSNTWVEAKDMRHYYNLKRCVAGGIEDAKKQLLKQSDTNTTSQSQ